MHIALRGAMMQLCSNTLRAKLSQFYASVFLPWLDRYFFVVVYSSLFSVTCISQMLRNGANLERRVQGWESPILWQIDVEKSPVSRGFQIQNHQGSHVVQDQCKLLAYTGITHSPLSQHNSSLPLPLFGGNYPNFLLDNIH